ncbi:MAG: precorrin-4 C(11)-methyltransferase, partial [Sphaerospermopsis kisseleviana]
CTQQEQLLRNTRYIISPALLPVTSRSRLYHPQHNHLFRSSHH